MRSSSSTEHRPGLEAASERLLVRLGFDLHDGPLQQVYVLAQDVRVLRDHVFELLEPEQRQPALDAFADVETQLAELHRDLRDLAHSLEPRSLLQGTLPDAVARELAAHERRTDISVSLTLDGAFDALTDSQRIALLRVLQEALSNIRRHSGARTASVHLTDDGDGVRMEIRDDGRGFDAVAALAARRAGERHRPRRHARADPAARGPARADLEAWRPDGRRRERAALAAARGELTPNQEGSVPVEVGTMPVECRAATHSSRRPHACSDSRVQQPLAPCSRR